MSAEQSVQVEGGEERPPTSSPTPLPPKPKLRLQRVDRRQIVLEVVDTDRLVEQDHEVRAILDLLGRLDLSLYYEGIKAIEGRAGRGHSDPPALLALWIYASLRGVQAGRGLAEWSKYEPGCRWLLGLRKVNHTTLSKLLSQYQAALHDLFVQVVHVLMAQGAIRQPADGCTRAATRAAPTMRFFRAVREKELGVVVAETLPGRYSSNFKK